MGKKMKWKPRLLLILASAICAVSGEAGGRWLWPDDVVSAPRSVEQPVRKDAGRVIQGYGGFLVNPGWTNAQPLHFPAPGSPHKPQGAFPSKNLQPPQPLGVPFFSPLANFQTQKVQPALPSPPQTPGTQFLTPAHLPATPANFPSVAPVSSPPLPTPVVTSTKAGPPSSGLLSSSTERPVPAVTATDEEEEGSPKEKKNSTVPLLSDAGKPGNPYELLNKIFPPEQRIRSKEEEEANLNSLANEDLGGLDPHEVYLSDGDLLVIRGFNFKKPYNPDPPGPPISDYEAPAPNAPPPPEPGTAFYPLSNDTDRVPGFPLPDFNQTDFSPFIPAGLDQNSTAGIPFFPFPFLPPPPPPFDSTKEEPEQSFGEFPFPPGPFGTPGQGPPGPFGTPGQGSPGQGPPGPFPPGPFGTPGQGLPGSSRPVPPPPSGLPPKGPVNGSFPTPPGFPEFIFPPGNFTEEDDDFVPFTPLFPSRPVEYYYPKHNTTALPPGPFGPGIFVPPPKSFFAPRNRSEELPVKIPSALFKPPFNLPNYYEKPKVVKENTRVIRPQIIQQPNQLVPKQPVGNTHPFLGNFPLVSHVRVVEEQTFQPGNRFRPELQRPSFSVPRPISLESDINVNFRKPRPEIDPDSELIDVSLLQPQNQNRNGQPQPTTPPKKLLKYVHNNQRLPGATLQLQPTRETYVSVHRNDGGSYAYNLGRRR